MVKYREIIKLRAFGVSMRNIAESCGCSASTASNVLNKAKAYHLEWPLPEELDDAALKEILFPTKSHSEDKHPIDCEHVARELERKGVTRMLLWNEYCEEALNGGRAPYQYSQFCEIMRKWAKTSKVTMRLEHKPADQIQVDWIGTTLRVTDPDTGETHKVHLFIASLPYSNYLYVEGFFSLDLECWIAGHIHAFEAFCGATPILVPDNLKTGVLKHTKDELILNDTYRRMAEHYGCAVVPARVRRPQDKAAVEMGVRVVTNDVIAVIRDEEFFSLARLNRRIRGLVAKVNDRPFQKREGSRRSVYLAKEKPLLIPLPAQPFEIYVTKRLTVNSNYHVSLDGAHYSVPFPYAGKEVDVRATRSTVTVAVNGERIAIHKRHSGAIGAYVTDPMHMPESHREYLAWTPARFREWARSIGPSTADVMDAILASKSNIKWNHKPCRMMVGLSGKHGDALVEEACAKALMMNRNPSYKTVSAIIKSLAEDARDPNRHAYLRGADYYQD